MKTRYSRRYVIAGGAVALIGTTLTGRAKAQTATQTPDGAKAPAGNPKSEPSSAINTRRATVAALPMSLGHHN